LLVTTTLLPLANFWPIMQLVNFLIIFGIIIWATISLHAKSAWNILKALVMTPVSFFLYVALCSVLVALALDVPLSDLMRHRRH
jgi:hypothetical protein